MMTEPKWDETEPEQIMGTGPNWDDTVPEAEPIKEPVSKLKTAALAAGQGATAGWLDELGGAVLGSVDYIANKIAKSQLSPEQQKQMETPEFKQFYQEERDKIRDQLKQAQEQNPGTFLSGELAGGIAGPGGLALKAGKKLASNIVGFASQGALAGAGYSEGKDAGEVAKDTAAGAVVGGALGAVPAMGNLTAGAAKKVSKLYEDLPGDIKSVINFGLTVHSPAAIITLYGMRKLGPKLLSKLRLAAEKGEVNTENLSNLVDKGNQNKIIDFVKAHNWDFTD